MGSFFHRNGGNSSRTAAGNGGQCANITCSQVGACCEGQMLWVPRGSWDCSPVKAPGSLREALSITWGEHGGMPPHAWLPSHPRCSARPAGAGNTPGGPSVPHKGPAATRAHLAPVAGGGGGPAACPGTAGRAGATARPLAAGLAAALPSGSCPSRGCLTPAPLLTPSCLRPRGLTGGGMRLGRRRLAAHTLCLLRRAAAGGRAAAAALAAPVQPVCAPASLTSIQRWATHC